MDHLLSVFTLTGTAVDRFRAVICPQRPKMTQPAARVIIFIIWAISIACSLPYGLYHHVAVVPTVPKMKPGCMATDNNNVTGANNSLGTTNKLRVIILVKFKAKDHSEVTDGPGPIVYGCYPKFTNETWWKVYNIYLTIIQYFVPLFIINGAYCVIGYNVWLTESVIENSDPRALAFEKSKRRVIKMLVIVVMVFTFCWLPYETYLVLVELRPNINDFYYINVIFFCCHWLAMSNSCLNPIIYGIYNEKFKNEYKRVFRRCLGQEYSDMVQIPMDSCGDLTGEPAATTPAVKQTRKSLGICDPEIANSCHFYIASELGND